MRCKYNDCGFCYAPEGIPANDKAGQCLEPSECPANKERVSEVMITSDRWLHFKDDDAVREYVYLVWGVSLAPGDE